MQQLQQNETIAAFSEALASGAPTPGGGGACALAGALGAALGSMVCALTSGKRRYADVEEDIRRIASRMEALRQRLLALIDADAEAFLPLSRAYGMPRGTQQERAARDTVMEAALVRAAQPPLDIMEVCAEAVALHAELGEKGSALAISDVGVGAALSRAALQGASLNVFTNTRLLRDRQRAAALDARAQALLGEALPEADRVVAAVMARLTAPREG